uniref:Uncharacterized protein n=1 Tax=Rhizobium rhizogenes TaxID=359 RepID=A0A7S4ZT73_RHIRH|nr:hypothetical protein pC5.8b_274 [Rhizobium rhizogenes]
MIIHALGRNSIPPAKAHHFRGNSACHVLNRYYLDRKIANLG